MSQETSKATLPSQRARQAHQNARYIVATMNFNYDKTTGIAAVGGERADQVYLVGSLGEIMTDARFYVPQVNQEADRIDLAFELGFLLGRQQEQQNG